MRSVKVGRRQYIDHQVMGNSTKQKMFGDVKIIQRGEQVLKLSLFNQAVMTIEEAYRLYENGLAVSVA